MAYEFRLPDIGEGLTEATVVAWLVPVGAAVGNDDPVVELETDKAVVEIPAPRAGVVLHHGAGEGEVVEVDSLLFVIGDEGEVWEPPDDTLAPSPETTALAAPIVGDLEDTPAGSAVLALPAVRHLALELDVDLTAITGSGPGGRITRSDVEGAAGAAGESGRVERVKLSPVRRSIARSMTRSWTEIPHVTTYGSADAVGILAERSGGLGDGPLPLEALLMAAVTPQLVRFPEFNASLEGDELLLRKHYDVGFAVDTSEGLMVAVVRDANERPVEDLAAEIVRLSAAARDRTIDPAEMRGATFTISNIGAVGGRFGTPLIPLGTTAILSVGRAEEAAVVRGGQLAVGREMPLSLSYDHRVIDGALGRRFLAAVAGAIEARSA